MTIFSGVHQDLLRVGDITVWLELFENYKKALKSGVSEKLWKAFLNWTLSITLKCFKSQSKSFSDPISRHCSRKAFHLRFCTLNEINHENFSNAAWVIKEMCAILSPQSAHRKHHINANERDTDWTIWAECFLVSTIGHASNRYLWILISKIFRLWILSLFVPSLNFERRWRENMWKSAHIKHDFCYRLFPIVCAGSSLYILLCFLLFSFSVFFFFVTHNS